MKHLGLFEGIGGFSLAARWAGWETVAMVECDKHCQTELKINFPNTEIYGDIRGFDGKRFAGKIDIITGGFPCQPFSSIGKRAGAGDDRYLWPEMLRVIGEVRPRWVVGENADEIYMADGGVWKEIRAGLENLGYKVEGYCVPALAVGAPHLRNRAWIVANAESKDGHSGDEVVCAQADSRGNGGQFSASDSAAHIREVPTSQQVLFASEAYGNGYGVS